MTFEQWFDVENPEHLRAFQHMRENGEWPEYFVPGEYEFFKNCIVSKLNITFMLADRYCEKALADKGEIK